MQHKVICMGAHASAAKYQQLWTVLPWTGLQVSIKALDCIWWYSGRKSSVQQTITDCCRVEIWFSRLPDKVASTVPSPLLSTYPYQHLSLLTSQFLSFCLSAGQKKKTENSVIKWYSQQMIWNATGKVWRHFTNKWEVQANWKRSVLHTHRFVIKQTASL